VESTNLPAAASAYARLAAQTTNHSVAASALQAQARCLVQAGQNEEAVSALSGWLTDERYGQATDGYGRLIAPNAALMAIELLKTSNPDQAHEWFERLRTRWLGYDSAMPASQRRFLMRELQTLFPQDAAFPALAAEDLAQRWLESGVTNHLEPVLQESPLTGVWQFASAHGRVLSLHLATNLIARMAATVGSQELPADVRVDFIAPGQEPVEASLSVLPAGPALPGWRLGLVLRDPRLLATATREQIMAYVWMGVLIVGTVVLLAFLALGMVRRQAALTQLRNDLVANVTHELKTPLSSMRLLVETLLNSPQIHEQTAREYLDLIAKENVRLSRLIDNFLTFSRIERNKYTFDFKPAPAAAIAESAAAAVRERFSAPGCRFEVEIAPDLPSVVADADAMVMALVNLLDNAYKYSGEAKQITFTAGIEDGNVRFAVEDNGIGLSPRDTKRIFKRFHQVNPHLSPTGGGCGLGLSIVQFVVTAHRGTVRVESEPGRGSTFIVCIPAGEPHAGPEAKP
jgi:signal transduction histidine kinase